MKLLKKAFLKPTAPIEVMYCYKANSCTQR